jgi:hypothetical protein
MASADSCAGWAAPALAARTRTAPPPHGLGWPGAPASFCAACPGSMSACPNSAAWPRPPLPPPRWPSASTWRCFRHWSATCIVVQRRAIQRRRCSTDCRRLPVCRPLGDRRVAARHPVHRLPLAGDRLLAEPTQPSRRLGFGTRRVWRRLHPGLDRRPARPRLAPAGGLGRHPAAARRRRTAAGNGLDPAAGRTAQGQPAARQCAAEPEMGPAPPAAVDRHLPRLGPGPSGDAHRVAGNRDPALFQ